MAKPIVAIVGRPNVGKSTFFNKMIGERIAIVEDTPGVTRDRIYGDATWQRYAFSLVDTGGIDPYSEDPLLRQMRAQAQIAIDTADVILFFVDGAAGLTGADEDVAQLLRRSKKPIVLCGNKVDSPKKEDSLYDFYSLGLGEPFAISSVNLLGLGDLLDQICSYFPDPDEEEEESDTIHICVAGRPNVGKSSLVNHLLGEERVMVSNIPGTTRDAIDTPFTDGTHNYTIIDTAGIRRKNKIEDATLERYSVIRSLAAIRRCDVALLLLDAADGITEQDERIAGYIHEEGRGCIIVVNKWDAVEKQTETMNQYIRQIRDRFKFLDYAPVLFLSAKTGQRTQLLLPEVLKVYENANQHIPTGILNEALGDAMTVTPPPAMQGRRLKLYYITQRGIHPPTFLLFVNKKELMHFSYERYLENHFRKTFSLSGTPIRFYLREREDKEDL